MLRNDTGSVRWVVIHLLAALAISLVVNFSYMLLLIVDERPMDAPPPRENRAPRSCRMISEFTGVLQVAPDGYGYLIDPLTRDSVYVPQPKLFRFGLCDGDTLRVKTALPNREDGHYILRDVVERNGEEYDPALLYHRPSEAFDITVQLLFYLCLSFLMILLITFGAERNNYALSFYLKRVGCCLVAVVPLYMLAPVFRGPSGDIVFNFMSGHPFNYMVLLRQTFAVVVSMLYGYLYGLLRRSQQMALENERLKNENLTSRYNMLVSQINPHFFFNSLNSLAMLVRETQNDRALDYIEQLSYVFRYIIQNGRNMLVPLDEELRFAEAYSYLFRTRYADKLFFDFSVDGEHRNWQLPALTLQPLIENAVKHNTITRNNPFHVQIRTEGDRLVVSNPRIPKIDPEPGTGIGLENLKNRWELITGGTIEVVCDERKFEVRLPLQKPAAK